MTLNDYESPKKGFLVKFFAIFRNFSMQRTFQHGNVSKWLEINQNTLQMKFSALNVDFSSLSPDSRPLSSRRPAQAGVKDSCSPTK